LAALDFANGSHSPLNFVISLGPVRFQFLFSVFGFQFWFRLWVNLTKMGGGGPTKKGVAAAAVAAACVLNKYYSWLLAWPDHVEQHS